MTPPNPPEVPFDTLRSQILKQAKVTKAKVVWSQKMYSNGTASPIEMSNQDVVEIGINELMEIVSTTLQALVTAQKPELPATFAALDDFGVMMYKKATFEYETNLLKALKGGEL